MPPKTNSSVGLNPIAKMKGVGASFDPRHATGSICTYGLVQSIQPNLGCRQPNSEQNSDLRKSLPHFSLKTDPLKTGALTTGAPQQPNRRQPTASPPVDRRFRGSGQRLSRFATMIKAPPSSIGRTSVSLG